MALINFSTTNLGSNTNDHISHYYGDIVRLLFLTSALLMLVSLPFLREFIPITPWLILIVILFLSIFSGITNPKVFIFALVNSLIAFLGTFIHGYYALDAYIKYGAHVLFFWVNQILASLFLLSLYFAVKTVRGFIIDHEGKEEVKNTL